MRVVMLNIAYAIYRLCDMQHLQNAYAIYRKCDMQHLQNAYAYRIFVLYCLDYDLYDTKFYLLRSMGKLFLP